ncbi:MAG: hypothetical protein R3C00_09540 [Hyphomonas sp.]
MTFRRRRWIRQRLRPLVDPRYAGVDVPATESLQARSNASLPYWDAKIAGLRSGTDVMIAAPPGDSLRALVKHQALTLPDDPLQGLRSDEIPPDRPADENLKPIAGHYLVEIAPTMPACRDRRRDRRMIGPGLALARLQPGL